MARRNATSRPSPAAARDFARADPSGPALDLVELDGEHFAVFAWDAEPIANSDDLTQAERDVLRGILAGRSNVAIANLRRTSVRTVANQVASLLRKLGAGSRLELIRRAAMAPGGELVRAEGPAIAAHPDRSRVEALLSTERAGGRVRRAAPDEALRSWAVLLAGRWTIIDTMVSNGKRVLLARVNAHQPPVAVELTPAERDVAWLAALGHSYKYIALELGHPLSTVVSRLRRAMQKLGASSRADLVARLGQICEAQR